MTSDVAPFSRTVLPSLGFAAGYTLSHHDRYLFALIAFGAVAVLVVTTLPRLAWFPGLRDVGRGNGAELVTMLSVLALAGLVHLPGHALKVAPMWWPVYAVVVTAVMLWTFRAMARRNARIREQRVAACLAGPSPEVTPDQFRVAAEHPELLDGLLALCAIDGLQTDVSRLGYAVGKDGDVVTEGVGALHRAGLVNLNSEENGKRQWVDLSLVGVWVSRKIRTQY